MYKGTPIRLSANALQGRRECGDIFNKLKEKFANQEQPIW